MSVIAAYFAVKKYVFLIQIIKSKSVMKFKFTRLIFVVYLLIITAVDVIGQIPAVSTEGNEIWYIVYSSPRNSAQPEAKWLTGATDGGELSVSRLTGESNQLWKVVEHGEGYALVNKQYQTYMDTDQRWNGELINSLLYASGMRPATPVKFVPSLLLNNGVVLVDIDTEVSEGNEINSETISFSYYSVGSDIFKPITYHSINLHSSVRFIQAREVLGDAISSVRLALQNVSIGSFPGQYPYDVYSQVDLALADFDEIYNDPDIQQDVYLQSAIELMNIFEFFKETLILPEISTENNSIWYIINSMRPVDTYLSSSGNGGFIPQLPITIGDDRQLWRLVENPNGGFAIQNKFTSEFINADLSSNSKLPTQAEMPQNGLRFIASHQTTSNIVRFWIENIENSVPSLRLHAGSSHTQWSLMNWTGNANDNSTWIFMDPLNELKRRVVSLTARAREIYSYSVAGDILGQYNKELRDEFFAFIEVAEAVDIDDMSEEELDNMVSFLENAISEFKCNVDVSTLESTTPHTTHRWFRIVNAAVHQYARDKAMSSRGRNVEELFTFENVDLEADEQLFRFELNEDKTQVVAIVNKANNMYLAGNGFVVDEAPAINFDITSLDGYSFWIKPSGLSPLHAKETGTHIVNWNAGAGSASAWRIIFVKDESNIQLLDEERTITITSSQPSKGSAFVTGSTDSFIRTNIKNISVTAEPFKGYFFVNWTNADGEVLSPRRTLIYSGEEDVEIFANFEDGYYLPMTRFFTRANPALQSEDRYLEAVWANIGENMQTIFEDVYINPLPLNDTIKQNQIIPEAIVDLTSEPIIVPLGVDSIEVVFKARVRESVVENLHWTRQVVFVDWDKDFSFLGDNERTDISSTSLIETEGFVRKIAIPADLNEDIYRMRVVYNETTDPNWGVSIWVNNQIRNGIAYDFSIKYGNPTSVQTQKDQSLSIRVMNSVITVIGDENFELYTIAGQRISNKQILQSGVYIVKSGSNIEKVMIK